MGSVAEWGGDRGEVLDELAVVATEAEEASDVVLVLRLGHVGDGRDNVGVGLEARWSDDVAEVGELGRAKVHLDNFSFKLYWARRPKVLARLMMCCSNVLEKTRMSSK